MQRFVRRKDRPQPGRGPARWTGWEIALMILSLLLIIFPLYAEGYRWLNPLTVPAAPLPQRATNTSIANTPVGATDTPTTGVPPVATDTPTTGVPPVATDTPTTGVPPVATDTPTTGVPPVATNTPTTGVPPAATNTPTVGTPPAATDTPTVGTPPVVSTTPTNGPSPTPTATLTPLPNEPPLRLNKAASVSSVQTNQKFNYTLTVFSNSANASTVDVRDTIDGSLEIVGSSASNGTCTTANNLVTCKVTVQNNQPVTIDISVQVRSTATAGQRIPNQALAQDDRSFTAASARVVVDVSGGGAVPPSITPGGPTVTPGGPTNTPGGPTNTPVTPTSVVNPTAAANPTSSGGGGGGGG